LVLVCCLLYSTIKVEVGEGTMKSDKVDRRADEPKVQLEVEVETGVSGLEGQATFRIKITRNALLSIYTKLSGRQSFSRHYSSSYHLL
jgi:hypothetical protein